MIKETPKNYYFKAISTFISLCLLFTLLPTTLLAKTLKNYAVATKQISVTIGPKIGVSGLDDVTFDHKSDKKNLIKTNQICVYSNAGIGEYKVIAIVFAMSLNDGLDLRLHCL